LGEYSPAALGHLVMYEAGGVFILREAVVRSFNVSGVVERCESTAGQSYNMVRRVQCV